MKRTPLTKEHLQEIIDYKYCLNTDYENDVERVLIMAQMALESLELREALDRAHLAFGHEMDERAKEIKSLQNRLTH